MAMRTISLLFTAATLALGLPACDDKKADDKGDKDKKDKKKSG